MHESVRLDCPIEFINITPVNPLISKCQIKVCYVDDKPNRNRSVITKEVARKMANSLPGCPIVGYYNETKEDFEEHNRIIEFSDGEIVIKDTTKPYGFVDLNAKVWFAKYLDDDSVEREYLVTEGYLWTKQYPECQRVFENGNNHSMELDDGTIKGTWTKDESGKPQFFIINEAIIEKLCILGENNEPCFEGSNITKPEVKFSYEDGFKQQLFAMMNELKDLLKEGGAEKVFTTYAVEIGDHLWESLYRFIETQYPDPNRNYCSLYRVDGIFEENTQKFAVLQNRIDMRFYRMNFSLTDETGFVPSETLIEVTKSYTPAEEPQFALDAVEEYETEYAKKKAEEMDKVDEDNQNKIDYNLDGEKTEEPEGSDNNLENPIKPTYSLEEIPEYVELLNKFSELEEKYNALTAEKEALNAKLEPLIAFKADAEKQAKESMINSFYMLSDEDKADVITNIDNYSLEDIEAKLSIICVRNKVSFDSLEDKNNSTSATTTFNLNNDEVDNTPAWVKRALSVAETLK